MNFGGNFSEMMKMYVIENRQFKDFCTIGDLKGKESILCRS